RRRALKKPTPVVGRGELVEGKIPAHGREGPGVLGQALRLELGFRELAPRLVTLPTVDRPEPARVFPTTGAEEHATLGQGLELRSEAGGLRRQLARVGQWK